MSAVAPGTVLAGKYRVDRILGQGGMGVVVAATHLQLDKKVALKFLLPEVLKNAELVERFRREAKAASKISSEHIAKVSDVGVLENGAPFMEMEYLEGSDLSQLIKQRGALGGQEAIEYVLQACEALAEAHTNGIVHRDLKPANLFLTHRPDGTPSIKVLDFGISKVALASDQGQAMTQTSAVMGSPSYMAPEQLKSSRNVDQRTDIWSLGIIFFELLTGHVAFRAETVPELYVNILQQPPPPLRSLRPDAPPAMEAVIFRCLEKDPARRFANVGELARSLADLAPARARPSVERIERIIAAALHRAGQGPPPGQIPATQVGAPPTYVTGVQQARPSYSPGPPVAPMGPGGGTPQPTYHGPSQAPYGATPQPSPVGYGPPQPTFTGQAPPQGYGPPQPQAPSIGQSGPSGGMSGTTIGLILLVAALIIGGGSCMLCMCVAAADNPKPHRKSELRLGPEVWGLDPGPRCGPPRAPMIDRDVGSSFQQAAGWSSVSARAVDRHDRRLLAADLFVRTSFVRSRRRSRRKGVASDVAKRQRAR